MKSAGQRQFEPHARRPVPHRGGRNGQRPAQRGLTDIGDPLRDYIAVGPWIGSGLLCVILAWGVSAPKIHQQARDEGEFLTPLELQQKLRPQPLRPDTRESTWAQFQWVFNRSDGRVPCPRASLAPYRTYGQALAAMPRRAHLISARELAKGSEKVKADEYWTRGRAQWYKGIQEAPPVQPGTTGQGRQGQYTHSQRPHMALLVRLNTRPRSTIAHV